MKSSNFVFKTISLVLECKMVFPYSASDAGVHHSKNSPLNQSFLCIRYCEICNDA